MLEVAARQANMDFESVETAVRAAVLAAGATSLGHFMTAVGTAAPKTPVLCGTCRQRMCRTGPRGKTILTMLGQTAYTRSRYACAACGTARYPGDEALDLFETSRSPGVRRQVARLGANMPFHKTANEMRLLAGVRLSRKDAERISESVGEAIETWDMRERDRIRWAPPPQSQDAAKTIETLYIEYDGTGVPMVQSERQGRKGKQPDGSAKTREAKLGCVFTQTAFDEKGRPIRDPASTTFTGAIENAALFGWRIYAEAERRGLSRAKRVAVLGDGAPWIRNLAQTHFGNAIHIVDLYHAREHVHALCNYQFDRDLKLLNHYYDRWWDLLDQGAIETIAEQATALLPKDPQAGKDARREINYLLNNKDRMRYRDFKAQRLFVGSGVIEASCRTLVGQRLKESGMEWTVRGANAIIALRCAELSNKTEHYWEQRTG